MVLSFVHQQAWSNQRHGFALQQGPWAAGLGGEERVRYRDGAPDNSCIGFLRRRQVFRRASFSVTWTGGHNRPQELELAACPPQQQQQQHAQHRTAQRIASPSAPGTGRWRADCCRRKARRMAFRCTLLNAVVPNSQCFEAPRDRHRPGWMTMTGKAVERRRAGARLAGLCHPYP